MGWLEWLNRPREVTIPRMPSFRRDPLKGSAKRLSDEDFDKAVLETMEQSRGKVPLGQSDLLRWSKAGRPHPSYIKTVWKTYTHHGVYTRVNNLVAKTTGVGFYTSMPDEDEPTKKKSKTPAKEKLSVDKMCETVGMDEKAQKIFGNLLIYGFAPTEPVFSKGVGMKELVLLPPESMLYQPLASGKVGVKGYVQNRGTGNRPGSWRPDELVWFDLSFASTGPYGTSLVAIIKALMDIQNNTISDLNKIITRIWKFRNIWKTENKRIGKMLEKQLNELPAGKDLVIFSGTDGRVEHDTLKTDPRVPFWEYPEFIDDRLSDELQSPTLSKFKQATEASARVMMDEIVDGMVQGFQRYMKRRIERDYFKPHLQYEANSLDSEVIVPRLNWGMPTSFVKKLKPSDIAMLCDIRTGPVFTPKMGRYVLKQMGVPVLDDPEANNALTPRERFEMLQLLEKFYGSEEKRKKYGTSGDPII